MKPDRKRGSHLEDQVRHGSALGLAEGAPAGVVESAGAADPVPTVGKVPVQVDPIPVLAAARCPPVRIQHRHKPKRDFGWGPVGDERSHDRNSARLVSMDTADHEHPMGRVRIS